MIIYDNRIISSGRVCMGLFLPVRCGKLIDDQPSSAGKNTYMSINVLLVINSTVVVLHQKLTPNTYCEESLYNIIME